jgi:transcriptional regulator with XRE-family HTH domain
MPGCERAETGLYRKSRKLYAFGYLDHWLDMTASATNKIEAKSLARRKGHIALESNRADRMQPGIPNPVDIHVGSRVRLRRTLLGLSQEKLGEAVGLTFQQIQKYERGANRIGASRLFEFSRILDVPVSFFFDDMAERLQAGEGQGAFALADQPQAPLEPDPLTRRETLELVRAYYRIVDPQVRKRLFELTKSLGTSEDAE